MPFLNFGQPVDGLIQTALVVEDIRKSMEELTRHMRIGPWFLRENFVFGKQEYYGKPSTAELSIAMGYSGHMLFELIQQHNDEPSVYRDVVTKRGYGLHHFGVAAARFDDAVAGYHARGYRTAFWAEVAPGVRVEYFDTTDVLPAMVELIEMKPSVEAMFTAFQQASVGWDGADPVRMRAAAAPAR